jgi:hypothetical protein
LELQEQVVVKTHEYAVVLFEYCIDILRSVQANIWLLRGLPNESCSELLAIKEFNEENELRIIEHHKFFENERIFRRPLWVKQIFYFHVLDHPIRNNKSTKKAITNPYLSYKENVENFEV